MTPSGYVHRREWLSVKRNKIFSACLLAASAPLVLAGCSSSGSGASGAKASTGAAAGSGASSTGSAAASAGTVGAQLTGTQLQHALLTAAQLPSDVTLDPSSDSNSGGSPETGTKYSLAGLDCNDLLSDIGTAGFGEHAMAAETAADSNTGLVVADAVYQFSGSASAHTFYAALQAKWSACGTFTETGASSSDTAKLTVSSYAAPSGLGEDDFGIRIDGKSSTGSQAQLNTVVLQGTDLYLLALGSFAANSADTLSGIDDTPMIKQQMANVAAAH
jgi:hypothetical protein